MPTDGIDAEALARLEEYDWVMQSLRLYLPLTMILRRTQRDCEFGAYVLPARTSVAVYPVATHRDPQWWSEPDAFDPERFSPARAEHRRHAFAWAPFGGGAQMCLGLHFAELQVRAVLSALLRKAALHVAQGYTLPYVLPPLAHPRDGLPIQLRAV